MSRILIVTAAATMLMAGQAFADGNAMPGSSAMSGAAHSTPSGTHNCTKNAMAGGSMATSNTMASGNTMAGGSQMAARNAMSAKSGNCGNSMSHTNNAHGSMTP